MTRATRVAALLAAALCAAAHARDTAEAGRGGPEAAMARVEVAFTPGDDIEALVVRRIGAARESVRMQAYLFTDARVARALLAALERGVEVEIIGDAGQHAQGGLPWLAPLARAGAHVWLDGSAAASHNKILIVDGGSAAGCVVTGSYNFTRAAQEKNAENVVVISGNRAIAERFVENFRARRALAQPWEVRR